MRSNRLGRVAGAINRRVVTLAGSPRWGRFVGRWITIVSYVGRRSGRTFRTPVGYRRRVVDSPAGAVEQVMIPVDIPEQKNWWRNFTGDGASLSLRLPEGVRTGHAKSTRVRKGKVIVLVRLDPVRQSGLEAG